MRWPRRQPGRRWTPGPVTLIAVAVVAFGSAFGVARAAGGGEPSGAPASAEPRPAALRTASDLPAMNAPPGPTEAELVAQREARERARKRRLAKEAKEKAAREERQRLRAERRAQRAAEREAETEAKRQAAAERKRKARERKRQQEENAAPQQPEQTRPEPPPPTSTTPVGEPFDDSG
jgi:colicin import membrane protein